jgi:hypothetical protein
MYSRIIFFFITYLINTSIFAQSVDIDSVSILSNVNVPNWSSRINIRGYSQIRYNRLLETNPQLGCEQCDKSWGENGGFFMRRMRIIFFGQISNNIYVYFQPDFASSPSSDNLHFVQIRDAYFDVGIDKENEFRFRIGQSKVPYGFENMQSSQNRISLDRNDALNSAVSNERDIGVFFYWAPKEKRELLSSLVSKGLKGSGDYGIFALGIYNGQLANNPELNNEPHIVSRFSYPFKVKSQILELGIQAYKGNYTIRKNNISNGVSYKEDLTYIDERMALSFVLYPKPFGIQTEYTIGNGPRFNKSSNSIETMSLHGGYIIMSYMINIKKQIVIPFLRYQYYDGGKKHERDARSYKVSELEIGTEWQLSKNFELVVNYTISSRRYEDFILPDNLQIGNLLRIQAQVNF